MPIRPTRPQVDDRQVPPRETPAQVNPPARHRVVAVPSVPVEQSPKPNRTADGEYIVGKNRPPREHRFKKGVSGNPRGRTKGAKGMRTLTLEVLGERMAVRTATGERRMTVPELGLYKLRDLAAKGEIRAILEVFHRWAQAVPDIPNSAANGASPALSTAEALLIDAVLEGMGLPAALAPEPDAPRPAKP